MAKPMNASRAISGNFGEVYHDGQWITNAQKAEALAEINYEEVQRSGTRWVGHKATSITGTGSVTMLKVTSDFIKLIGSIADDRGTPYSTELIFKLDDPESFGAERVRLKNVQFTQIPLGGFEVGSLIEEELPFNFYEYELLDAIEEA